jgi:hypothetical protein
MGSRLRRGHVGVGPGRCPARLFGEPDAVRRAAARSPRAPSSSLPSFSPLFAKSLAGALCTLTTAPPALCSLVPLRMDTLPVAVVVVVVLSSCGGGSVKMLALMLMRLRMCVYVCWCCGVCLGVSQHNQKCSRSRCITNPPYKKPRPQTRLEYIIMLPHQIICCRLDRGCLFENGVGHD